MTARLVVTDARIIKIADAPVDLTCEIKIPSSPFGGYEIESDSFPLVVFRQDRVAVQLEGWPLLNMRVGRRDAILRGNQVKATLVIDGLEPLWIAPAGGNFRAVRFKLLNFQKFQGTSAESITVDGHFLDSTELSSDRWRIKLVDLPPPIGAKSRNLVDRDYAPTHEGVIRSADGEEFTAEEAESLIVELRAFFSFVRGNWCGVYDVFGETASESRVPMQWGTNHVAMRTKGRSWLPLVGGGESLARAFSGFSRVASGDHAKGSSLIRSIYHNLAAEQADFGSGIVLLQAALETLAWETLNRDLRKPRPARELIRQGLLALGVDTSVPTGFPELEELRTGNDWCDGVETLVRIRNEIVHPVRRISSLSGRHQFCSYQMGMHFARLALLRFINFSGRYRNYIDGSFDCLKCRPFDRQTGDC